MAVAVRFIYSNQAEGCTATASDAASGFPATAAVDMDRTSYWKSSTDSYTNEWLKVDLGSAKAITGLGLANHNIGTLTGTQKLQYSSDDAAWSDAATLTPSSTGDFFCTFTSQTKRYWRLLLNSAASQYPYVGEFYLGTAVTLAYNPDIGMEDRHVWQTLKSQSIAGHQIVKKTGRKTRQFGMEWNPVAYGVRDSWQTILDAQDGDLKPFFYVPRDDSGTSTQGAAYFVRVLENNLATVEVFTQVWGVKVVLEEQQ